MASELSSTNTYERTDCDVPTIIENHISSISKFKINISKSDVPTIYCLPKLHKNPYKFRFIANSSNCSTTVLSKNLTSAFTAIKDHVTKYCDTALNRNDINYFWSIKNSGDVIEKFKDINFQANIVSSYDFSNMYTTLPHNQIKDRLSNLIKWCFDREKKQFLCTSESKGFFSDKEYETYKMWTPDELCDALSFLLDNIFVRFGDTVYRQVVGIPMGTNCAPLIADLFLYTFERDFIRNLVKEKKYDVLMGFSRTSRYLDDILTIDNPWFDSYKDEIYPKELTLNKASKSDTETPFLDLNIKIKDGSIETSVYDKREDFDFKIINFPWLDGDVPKLPSYGIYISQLVRFARACTDVTDFHHKNRQLTEKLLHQGYRFHKLVQTFWKFFKNYQDLIVKYGKLSVKEYVSSGISQPSFYGDLVNKIRRVKGEHNFLEKCKRTVRRLLHRGYNPKVIKRTLSMVLGPYTAQYRDILDRCTLTGCDDGTL